MKTKVDPSVFDAIVDLKSLKMQFIKNETIFMTPTYPQIPIRTPTHVGRYSGVGIINATQFNNIVINGVKYFRTNGGTNSYFGPTQR